MGNLSQGRSQKRLEENDSINELSLDTMTSATGADQEVEMFHHSPFTPVWSPGNFWKGLLRRVSLEVWRWGESVIGGASAVGLKTTLIFTWKVLRKLCMEMIPAFAFLWQTRTNKAAVGCDDALSPCPGRAS